MLSSLIPRALTLSSDKGYADALWHGIDLYDLAGDLRRTTAALKMFIYERPNDPLAPDALLRLVALTRRWGV